MRTFILSALMAATIVPTIASAQSAAEVRHDNREVREQRRDLREARAFGDRHDVREARRDLRDARQERREDWRDYRRAHPDAFRGPAYAGPRGWRYRPLGVGAQLQPTLWGQRYWVDANRYRLPVASAGTRWIRYGNDVLLVNVRTGRVVTVYNSFFY